MILVRRRSPDAVTLTAPPPALAVAMIKGNFFNVAYSIERVIFSSHGGAVGQPQGDLVARAVQDVDKLRQAPDAAH